MSDLMELVKGCEKASDIVEDMVKITAAKEHSKRLYELGLVRVAQEIADKVDLKYRLKRVAEQGYIRITDEKIMSFLKKKAAEYDRGRQIPTDWGINEDEYRWMQQQQQQYSSMQYARAISIPAAYLGAQWSAIYRDQRAIAEDVDPRIESTVSGLEVMTKDYRSASPNAIGRFRWVQVPVSQYKGIPPEPVLAKLAEERGKGIFQEYHIASVEGIKDPLLLGIVKDCKDRFYLAQWGKDVALDDVI